MSISKSTFVRFLGPRVLLFLGDTLVFDRWLWLQSHLPSPPASLIDVGCGNGWLAVNCSRLGYRTLGIGWDGPDLQKARKRAAELGSEARFEVQDIRTLSARDEFKESFDIATCFETIEHILDDAKVMQSLAGVLRHGGRLVLTTPSYDYVPMDAGDAGPFSEVEDGRHVRKGYTSGRLTDLAEPCRLYPAWALTFPLRLIPPLLDNRGPAYPRCSICMFAKKV
jgi:SAM-dependent methyltransferase